MVRGCNSYGHNAELFLFTPEQTTAPAMLYNSTFGLDAASMIEKHVLSDTPLSSALANVSQGVLDYLWNEAHPTEQPQ